MRLDKSGLLERCVCTVLLEGAHTFRGDINKHDLAKLGDKDPALLEVSLAADFADWVELSRTRAV